MIDLHRQKMFEMEMQFLESKHERKRGMSNCVLRYNNTRIENIRRNENKIVNEKGEMKHGKWMKSSK